MDDYLQQQLLAAGWTERWIAAAERTVRGVLFKEQRRFLSASRIAIGGSALLEAPTGSGKSLLGRIAALNAARSGRVAVVLIPTRSLAAEWTRSLRECVPISLATVALSTGDHSEDDPSIRRGAVPLVVATWEKWRAIAGPSLRSRLGALVLDEAQLLEDVERGPAAEAALLSLLTNRNDSTAVVALAASLRRGADLARWLDVPRIQSAWRPVPLRSGVCVLGTGERWWREDPRGPLHFEPIATLFAEEHLLETLGEGRRVLYLTGSRARAWGVAAGIAAALPELRRPATIPEPGARTALEPLLHRGVAVHTSELGPAARAAVEDAFRSGAVRLLVATPTVQEGVNLPADTVFLDAARWIATGTGPLRNRLLGAAEFASGAGRAGRLLQRNTPPIPGEAWVLAEDEETAASLRRSLWKRRGNWQPPTLTITELASLLPLRGGMRGWDLYRQLRRCRAAQADPAHTEALLLEALRCGIFTHRADHRNTTVHLTARGRALARGGIALRTIELWEQLLADLESEDLPEPRRAALVLAALADAPAGRVPHLLDGAGRLRMRNEWHWRLGFGAGGGIASAVRTVLTSAPQRFPIGSAAVAEALLTGEDREEVQRRLQVLEGTMRDILGEAAHRLDALGGLAADLDRAVLAEACRQLAGHAREVFPPSAQICAPISQPTAPPMIPAPTDRSPGPRLVIHAGTVGQVEFDGRRLILRRAQFHMLSLLARRGAAGMTFEELEAALWESGQVERQQLYYHRREIERALSGQRGARAGWLIETRKGWGMALRLDPEAVEFLSAEDRTAAPPVLRCPRLALAQPARVWL